MCSSDLHALKVFGELNERLFKSGVFPSEKVQALLQISDQDEVLDDVDAHGVNRRIKERDALVSSPRVAREPQSAKVRSPCSFSFLE